MESLPGDGSSQAKPPRTSAIGASTGPRDAFNYVSGIPKRCKNAANDDCPKYMRVAVARPELFREFGRVVAYFANGVADGSLSADYYEKNPDEFTKEFRAYLVSSAVADTADLKWFDRFVLVPHFQRPEMKDKTTLLHLAIPDAKPDPLSKLPHPTSVPTINQHMLELGFRVLGGCFKG